MTNVTKEEYWTIILNDPTQIGQITTEDTEFNRRINDVNLVLSNTFINSSDENIISRWESSLYIDDIEGKTITERKADILYTLCEKNYVPVSIIKRFLTNLIGNENKFVIEFIKNENRLIIHTDRISNELFESIGEAVPSVIESVSPIGVKVEQYNHHIEVSWRDINKYANCKGVNDIIAVNPDYKNDLTSDLEWVYPLPNLLDIFAPKDMIFSNSPLRKIDIELPKVRNNGRILQLTTSLEEARVYLPECTDIHYFAHSSSVKKFYVYAPKAISAGQAFCNCPNVEEVTQENCKIGRLNKIEWFGWGSWNLKRISLDCTGAEKCNYVSNSLSFTSFESTLPNCTDGQRAFSGTTLDKPSVLRILLSLPAYEGDTEPTGSSFLFDLGIHVDHKNDEEVLAAIENAESKRWRLNIQWNGTLTNTASTMAMGQLIYAKVGEMERPDGTTEQYLDWAHYVTDETGYETFRSLESAYKYFNLEQPTEI